MAKARQQGRDTRYTQYLHPRWWPTWLAIFIMWAVARLPLRLQWWLGERFGEQVWRFASKRRHITDVNIRLCFPELPENQKQALVRQSFRANGIGVMELGMAWFRDPASFLPLTRVYGLEHLDAALARGRGVLLLGGHYSTLDLGGSLVTEYINADVMQRDHNNPLINAVMTRARECRYGQVLDGRDLRGLLKRLRKNRIVWYATDQDYGRKDIVFAPFFGVPAGSITATSRIAKSSGCAVVPFSHFRRTNEPGYEIFFHPPLENFPSGDDLADATLVNRTIENEIRKQPDQYLWMHRRFKTRPNPGDPNLYDRT